VHLLRTLGGDQQPERETVEAGLEGEAAPIDRRGQGQDGRLDLRAHGAERVRAVRKPTDGRARLPYARALALMASYSAGLIAPLSSSALALSISAAGPPLPATDLT
jgi:hypothetical protein